jgi:hypothetical protein
MSGASTPRTAGSPSSSSRFAGISRPTRSSSQIQGQVHFPSSCATLCPSRASIPCLDRLMSWGQFVRFVSRPTSPLCKVSSFYQLYWQCACRIGFTTGPEQAHYSSIHWVSSRTIKDANVDCSFATKSLEGGRRPSCRSELLLMNFRLPDNCKKSDSLSETVLPCA